MKPEVLLNIVTIAGGAFGTLVSELLWDRKVNKINAQSRIYTLVWLMIQFAIFWIIWGPNKDGAKMKIISFLSEHFIMCTFYLFINLLTFIVFGIDKIKAILGKWRIKEIYLLGLCLLGGSAGGLLAMDIFNHKVKSSHFMFGVPIMLCAHLVIISFVSIGII
ncbi:DUF1294 domain-containing protein [Pseudobutyrivibrio sp.]|uniref:DUF1294 domain-containing protein n=1 Tax=Pseudobutyrivibrio sp. TaxID=2014367 RepID=UPI0025EC9095|nr:DUF1294 domain-containing protein [Pseudobutyrivibrio sp.]